MIPTMKLRLVVREVIVPVPGYTGVAECIKKEVLQQWWEGDEFDLVSGGLVGEWRDVEVVK